jgi:sugar O-acyltransferase (sialic acid O-acetyltransferase NeuD family)
VTTLKPESAAPLAVWVLGAGGQARETRDLIRAVGTDPAGHPLDFRGLVDEPGEAALAEQSGALVLGAGFPALRDKLFGRFEAGGQFAFPVLVHPTADVGSGCELADGVVVSSGCVVTTDVRLGPGTLLNPRSGIGHDSVLGRCCVVNPGANVSGSVTIGDRVLIGSGATVLQGLRIGDDAVVGAGAVVTRDVRSGVTVVGVPAVELAADSADRERL